MDKYPLLWQGKAVGELTVRRDGEEYLFWGNCILPKEGLWSVWAVGTAGELRLGLPQLRGTRAVLEKRFSCRMTEPLGKLLHGELRLPQRQSGQEAWKPLREGKHFRTAWLERQIWNWPGVLWHTDGSGRCVAVPYDPKRPFPLMPMICFASLRRICGKDYLVVRLDHEEQPRF